MSGLLTRLRLAFIEPAEPAAQPQARAASAVLPSVAVVAAPAGALVVGGAAGLALADAAGSRSALVSTWWGAEPPRRAPRSPALRSATRVAASLAERGISAEARGRLVAVGLDPDPSLAAVEAHRAAAAALLPSVVVIAGPREPAVDRLIGEQDLVLLAAGADAPEGLAELAAAQLGALRPVTTVALPPGVGARALASAGVLALPAFRRVLRPALERLR